MMLAVDGDRLQISIGGDEPVEVDFSWLPEGAMLPADAIDCEWVCGPVTRTGGEIHLTLRLPHAAIAPHETRFPAPAHVVEDGPVALPDWGSAAPLDAVAVIDGVAMDAAEYAAWQTTQGGAQ